MVKADDLLEPRKAYYSLLKDEHHRNAEQFFDELTKKSAVDIEENRKTVKEYNTLMTDIEKEKAQRSKYSFLKGLCIFLCVVCIVFAFVFIYQMINAAKVSIKLLYALLAIALCVMFIVLAVRCGKKVKQFDVKIFDLTTQSKEKLDEAWKQMSGLNSLFDWNTGATLMTKTCPLIELDKDFNPKRFQFLHERFGFEECKAQNISTLYAQSGQILGNPFVFQQRYVQEMYNKAYTGSITISWVTYYTDSKGHRQTQHHTQVLEATTYHPAPAYYLDTWLIYGNDAAPKLSFTRKPSNANNMSDKEIEKMVKKSDKSLDKLVEKDVGDTDGNGSEFKRLANTKFETLFGALDRDNEVEFRLLFTPLAQKNLINLITENDPYGDDFHFVKKNKINMIKSAHMQSFDISCAPKKFIHYDYETIKRMFVEIQDEYFKNVFFDFAPLLSIPLYQQHKPKEYIYKDDYYYNLTTFEHECLANNFNVDVFKHPQTNTNVILKSNTAVKNGAEDIVTIDAYSFKEVPCVEYVSKMGGDGNMHSIPVHYFEYHDLHKATEMVAMYENQNSQNSTKDGIIRQRGLMAYIK